MYMLCKYIFLFYIHYTSYFMVDIVTFYVLRLSIINIIINTQTNITFATSYL